MKSVVVTGVSTGIGRGAASVLARKGWHVFGSVRREADARGLESELGEAFTPLFFDVEDNDAILAAAQAVRARLAGGTLVGLVNNAGASFSDPLLVQSVADFRRQIEINLVGMFAVTRAFAPLLGADPTLAGEKGRIVNISSVGGKMGPPFLGAYAAAKHGVEGFSESLRRELQLIGIDVIIVGPGAVATAIWDKAEALSLDHLAGTIWDRPARAFADYMIVNGRKGLTPEQVGEVIATALTARRPRTRYAVLRGEFMNSTLPSMLPRRMVDRMLGGRLGLAPKPAPKARGHAA
ncbi:MAG TPA: SDR family NAD(P)-dependent oxidoreductase [Caulobacteraceae bacterium]|nr:SDR family NAD(P)-dependent oxidoreductase [Caulobacteraceae bacterium]